MMVSPLMSSLPNHTCHNYNCGNQFITFKVDRFKYRTRTISNNMKITFIPRCEICSRLTTTKTERRPCRTGIFIVNFEHVSHLVLLFLLLTLNR